MSHGDRVENLDVNFEVLSKTADCPNTAIKHKTREIYGLQFHPEVTHTRHGQDLIGNFIRNICNCNESWKLSSFIEQQCEEIKARVDVFKDEAKDIKDAHFLAQGTLYPDVIESGANPDGPAATIKSHHNVGGLPAELGFELIEPLRMLFKDEVRRMGLELGLPDVLVWRHPFPGPGLAVRCLGDLTEERLNTLREADSIFIEELLETGYYHKVQQAFAVLLPLQTVGVMGDARTYEDVIALRSVDTDNFMTADWSKLPYDLLQRVSTKIINTVRGVNRVVYDISSKPPSTIEWE
ncbi:UNVERIFIED_CONTAM: hypothetical protein GTU68_050011 [Idotea baltica]|nr:hypothetical protein [Idotea baltica]